MTHNARALGARIGAARKIRGGISQLELSAKTGIAQSTISGHERGRTHPDACALAEYSAALKVPVGYFFGEVPISEGES